jgi:NAD(P)-dependent dehydrogenase (short-subunit alcohol dehydrogenase family)
MATEAEVAKAVMFFLSSDSGYVTGTNLMVDGGFTAS